MERVKFFLKIIGIFIFIKIVFFLINTLNQTSLHTPNHKFDNLSDNINELSVDVPKTGYHRYSVGYGVSVELPESWHILNDDTVKQISQRASVTIDSIPNKKTVIAANSSLDPDKNIGIFRLSFYDNEFTSDDLLVAKNQEKEINDICNEMSNNVITSLSKMGGSLSKRGVCKIGILATKNAFIFDYQRRSAINSNQFWRVRTYQIPLSEKTAMVTVSYKLGAPLAQEQAEEILNNLKIK